MKTEEDEAFEELAKRQGSWGGGFPAKRRMAAHKLEGDVDAFERWWYYEGSAPPQQGEDHEEHTKRMCQIAWSNGAYVAAQPAQEPVAWRWGIKKLNGGYEWRYTLNKTQPDAIPLYAASPKRPWVGLTEDELLHIGVATGLERAAAQMIEAKLKEKNHG